MMVDDKFDAKICKEMVQGEASPLQSTFRLSYYSLLNLLSRSDGLYDTEYVISHSFHQFQHEKELPQQKKRVMELEALLANAKEAAAGTKEEKKNVSTGLAAADDGDGDVAIRDADQAQQEDLSCEEENAAINADLRILEVDMLRLILRPKHCLKFLTYASLSDFLFCMCTHTLIRRHVVLSFFLC